MPRKDKIKKALLNIYVAPKQKDLLFKRAAKEGISMSELMRGIIAEWARGLVE